MTGEPAGFRASIDVAMDPAAAFDTVVEQLADRLAALKGVRDANLAMSSTGKALH